MKIKKVGGNQRKLHLILLFIVLICAGHRQRCEYLQDFLDALEMYKEDKENKEIDNELDKFIF